MKKIIFLLSVFFLGCSSDSKYLINEGVVNIDYLFMNLMQLSITFCKLLDSFLEFHGCEVSKT